MPVRTRHQNFAKNGEGGFELQVKFFLSEKCLKRRRAEQTSETETQYAQGRGSGAFAAAENCRVTLANRVTQLLLAFIGE